jgi:hypothetical protein
MLLSYAVIASTSSSVEQLSSLDRATDRDLLQCLSVLTLRARRFGVLKSCLDEEFVYVFDFVGLADSAQEVDDNPATSRVLHIRICDGHIRYGYHRLMFKDGTAQRAKRDCQPKGLLMGISIWTNESSR